MAYSKSYLFGILPHYNLSYWYDEDTSQEGWLIMRKTVVKPLWWNPQPSQSGKLPRDSQNLLFFLTPFTDFKTNTKAFGSNDSDEQ